MADGGMRIEEDVAWLALAGPILDAGALQRLADACERVVGLTRAFDMLLTGRVIAAPEAESWGLVTRTTAAATLVAETAALVREVLAGAPVALALAKEALLAAHDVPLAEGLRLEEDLYALLQTSADRAEGVRAFLSGRSPRFVGR